MILTPLAEEILDKIRRVEKGHKSNFDVIKDELSFTDVETIGSIVQMCGASVPIHDKEELEALLSENQALRVLLIDVAFKGLLAGYYLGEVQHENIIGNDSIPSKEVD